MPWDEKKEMKTSINKAQPQSPTPVTTQTLKRESPISYHHMKFEGGLRPTKIPDTHSTATTDDFKVKADLGCLGLPNLSLTCYMNSVLQSLLTLEDFCKDIFEQHTVWERAPTAQLMMALMNIMKLRTSDNMQKKTDTLSYLKKTISNHFSQFKNSGQEDAHEFLTCMLDQISSLSPALQYISAQMGRTYTCPVESQMAFKMLSTRTCKGCGEKSTQEADNKDLSLDVVFGMQVNQLLKRYMKQNVEYKCGCGANTSVLQWFFLTLPNVLVLHLKRFRLRPSKTLEKVVDPVLLTKTMTISIKTQQKSCYNLVSVISHFGSGLNSGVTSFTIMAKFNAPVIQDNPSGWGPCAVPEKFKDMPYQPFSKGDRLGKVADWTGATYQDKRYTNKYSSQFGGGSQYAYFHEEDETSFQLVDTAKTQKTAYQRNRMRFAQRNLRRDKDRRNLTQFNMQTLPKSAKQKERDRMRLQKKFQKQFGVRQKWDQKSQAQLKPRDSSVEVRSDWEVKEEMDFPRLMKMRYMEVADPVDIECCGALEYYDKAFDRITTRNEKQLKSIKRIFHTVTTTDDPVIRKLAKTQGNVFATDAILATLMCCTRSVNSWDIIVQRVGNKLFFDKRDNSDFDLLTVSETANEPPQDEGNSFNSPRNLAMEATYINHNFSQQCLRMGGERHKFPNPNPFVEEDMDKSEVASVAYRYRHWKLGEDIDLIVRCEHDGVMTGANGEVSFINIKTLNEWDSRYCNGVDWRQKLDSQRGAVLATELKNNSYKLARWTCCAMLAGSEYLKLGYVSRYHVKDSARHVILGTQQFKPNEFASQINLSMENAWGILRCVIDICRKLDEGKYLILKDPNKQVIRVYSLPDGTFSSDEEEEEEEDEEDEEEEDEEN
ncbi:hypothetical protein LDENG_00135590 [Lucifuga dentata]|nr:hypothetical protein LDENG_00135590 [Lucifuga dentata]